MLNLNKTIKAGVQLQVLKNHQTQKILQAQMIYLKYNVHLILSLATGLGLTPALLLSTVIKSSERLNYLVTIYGANLRLMYSASVKGANDNFIDLYPPWATYRFCIWNCTLSIVN